MYIYKYTALINIVNPLHIPGYNAYDDILTLHSFFLFAKGFAQSSDQLLSKN